MIPYIKGKVAEQAHVAIPDGLVEEEYARNGFFGKYAHLYRTEAPVKWTHIEGDLKPRCYDTQKLTDGLDFLSARRCMLYNDDVKVHYSKFKEAMSYFFRNADADELFFVHEGAGKVETDFGPLDYEEGDYILVPRGTVFRWHPKAHSEVLTIESMSEIDLPDKGMLGQHALFDPAVLRVPTPAPMPSHSTKDRLDRLDRLDRFKLKIQRCGQITTVEYPFYPINVVGWKGTLSVLQINVKDIRPISSDRYHLPPSAHSTFVAHNYVVCTFLPRPLENGDPKAMKVPFYHSNIDFDEVLFYHKGDFFSRTGVTSGMLTFHPQGIHHGPQGGAVERTTKATHTNEIAVMIDTKRPLFVADSGKSTELEEYWKSWL